METFVKQKHCVAKKWGILNLDVVKKYDFTLKCNNNKNDNLYNV